MHVAPVDLRPLRQGGIVLRFAMLGEMAYVFAELPATGSSGTSLETPCTQAALGLRDRGRADVRPRRPRRTIPAGRAFHVPAGGPEHWFEASGRRWSPASSRSSPSSMSATNGSARRVRAVSPDVPDADVVPAIARRAVPAGQIRTETWPMSSYLMTRVRMGERSGYTSGWCDAPHWGLMTAGRMAIEWEDDVEILSTGDIFHCPAGPPGHRLEAADPATFLDLTPIAAFGATRIADWRRGVEVESRPPSRGIAVAALG
jgi:quercetin dioxygenase-like cupin family protein